MVLGQRSWIGATRWATAHVVGSLSEHEDAWVAKLGELGEGREGVLISCADSTTELLARRRADIPPQLRSFESPSSPHLALMDKWSLAEIAEKAGVRHPRTLRLAEPGQLEQVISEARFPCLIKPAHSHRWREVLGERRAIVVDDPEALRHEAMPALEAGLETLVCEHIPGPDRALEGAMTVRGADGSSALTCGWRKVRMQPPGYGAAAIIESAEVPETVAMSKWLLDAVSFVGVSSTEFKRHAETGELYLIEVNVRVPQSWGLTETVRADGSWRLYAALAGLPSAPAVEPRLGVREVIPSLEARAAVVGIAKRRLSLRQVLAGYHRVRGLSGLSWRDPGPWLLSGAQYLRWVWGHLRRRGRT